MVDTGATASCIDRMAAERLHLLAEPSETAVRGVAAIDTTALKTNISTFSIGSTKTSLETYQVDLSAINAALQMDDDVAFDGILGSPFLRQIAAVIDYGAAKLFLKDQRPR